MMPINPKSGPQLNVLRLLERGAVLLDVRTREEFVGFHLPDAVNIPFEDLDRQLPTIRAWGRPVLVYSAADQRSRRALTKLHHNGIVAFDAGSLDQLRRLLAAH